MGQIFPPSFSLLLMGNRLPLATWGQKLTLYLGHWLGPRRFWRLKITGNSMTPMVIEGDFVLYELATTAIVSDIVFVSHPYMQSVKLVKRVLEIDADGKLFLVGDNEAESTDSRTLGWFSPNDVCGRIICRLK